MAINERGWNIPETRKEPNPSKRGSYDMDAFVADLRGQIPEANKEEIIGQVRTLLAMGISPTALQIALQLPNRRDVALATLQLI